MNREVCMIEIVRWSTYPIQWRRLEVGDPAISIMYRTANFEVHGRDRGLGPTIKIVRPVSRLMAKTCSTTARWKLFDRRLQYVIFLQYSNS